MCVGFISFWGWQLDELAGLQPMNVSSGRSACTTFLIPVVRGKQACTQCWPDVEAGLGLSSVKCTCVHIGICAVLDTTHYGACRAQWVSGFFWTFSGFRVPPLLQFTVYRGRWPPEKWPAGNRPLSKKCSGASRITLFNLNSESMGNSDQRGLRRKRRRERGKEWAF